MKYRIVKDANGQFQIHSCRWIDDRIYKYTTYEEALSAMNEIIEQRRYKENQDIYEIVKEE